MHSRAHQFDTIPGKKRVIDLGGHAWGLAMSLTEKQKIFFPPLRSRKVTPETTSEKRS